MSELTSKITSVFSTMSKAMKHITVEPLIICYLLPFLTTYAAIENMNLEKACRELVTDEIGFEKDICKLFVRKDEFGIKCAGDGWQNNIKIDSISEKFPEIYSSIANKSEKVFQFLCVSEDEAQKKLSKINSIRNPISSIGPLIIVLFAGPWSDKKNLRVPCMIVPYLGEAIGYLTLFIAAIFINGPVEFPAYAYRLLPSLTGAENLMILGVFSYLSAISSEEDRTFRFGIFQILMTIVPIIAQSISPTLVKRFDYTELFGAMIPVHIFGFLYAIFYLKEVKIPQKSLENAAYDNQGMSIENPPPPLDISIKEKSKTAKNAILEFFDPQHATKCITSLIKKREHNLRTILILLMLMHMLCNGVSQGEAQNTFFYVRSKLSWDVDTFVYFNLFNAVTGLIGTAFAVGILSKLLKFRDIFLVLLSTFLSIIARGVFAISSTTFQFFSGGAIDFTFSVKFLAVRAIISKIVPGDDLSTMFAVMGLFEALAGFLFPYIYPTFYEFLLSAPGHDISEMFMLSGSLMVLAFSVYIYIWHLLKLKDIDDPQNVPENPDQEESKL